MRTQAAEPTGIPAANIVVAAPHSHTAPDYTKALYQFLDTGSGDAEVATHEPIAANRAEDHATAKARMDYVARLIENTVAAVEQASKAAQVRREQI